MKVLGVILLGGGIIMMALSIVTIAFAVMTPGGNQDWIASLIRFMIGLGVTYLGHRLFKHSGKSTSKPK